MRICITFPALVEATNPPAENWNTTHCEPATTEQYFNFAVVSCAQVCDAFKKLGVNKLAGPDKF